MRNETCEPNCPMCKGTMCRTCGPRDPSDPCRHTDPSERHASAALRVDDRPGMPTEPLKEPLLAGTIIVDLSDAEAVKKFLELVGRIAVSRGKLKVTIE